MHSIKQYNAAQSVKISNDLMSKQKAKPVSKKPESLHIHDLLTYSSCKNKIVNMRERTHVYSKYRLHL